MVLQTVVQLRVHYAGRADGQPKLDPRALRAWPRRRLALGSCCCRAGMHMRGIRDAPGSGERDPCTRLAGAGVVGRRGWLGGSEGGGEEQGRERGVEGSVEGDGGARLGMAGRKRSLRGVEGSVEGDGGQG